MKVTPGAWFYSSDRDGPLSASVSLVFSTASFIPNEAHLSSGRVSATFQLSSHLILQPVALFLLPALRNSFLLVVNNSRQLTNVITVSSGSARILNEYERRSLHIASHSSTPKTVPLKSVLTTCSHLRLSRSMRAKAACHRGRFSAIARLPRFGPKPVPLHEHTIASSTAGASRRAFFSYGARGDKYVCFAGTMNKSSYLKVSWMLRFNAGEVRMRGTIRGH